MKGAELVRIASARAAELPTAQLGHPFGPEYDVFKVVGKVFALMSGHDDTAMVTVKANPDDALALREQHQDITPGYHMNKKHWITLRPGGNMDAALVRDIVTESYLLVVESLPRARRPVDPSAFSPNR